MAPAAIEQRRLLRRGMSMTNQTSFNLRSASRSIARTLFVTLFLTGAATYAADATSGSDAGAIAPAPSILDLVSPEEPGDASEALLQDTLARRPDLNHHARRLRAASVLINQPTLDAGLPLTLRLRLFNDVDLVARIDRRFDAPSGALYIAGRIDGDDASAVVIARVDGAVSASISTTHFGQFDLRPINDAKVIIREIDSSDPTGRACGAVFPTNAATPLQTRHPAIDASGAARHDAMRVRGRLPDADSNADDDAGAPRGGGGGSICPLQYSSLAGFVADDGSIVDLAVYYTPAALAAAGSVANIESEIGVSITYANNAYLNSGINTSLRLIHAAQVSYTESTSAITNLNRLVETNDGFLDGLHAERDNHGADLVSLWVGNVIDFGGVAYQLFERSPYDDGRYGFSVLREDNATFETLAHEVGHNFGCQHDRCNQQGTPFFDYGYGYRQPCPGPPPMPCSSPWPCTPSKDIMCYPPGTTVPYFSNPAILVGGMPIGGTDENGGWCDNATAHNGTRLTVANFRPSTVTPAPPSRIYVRASAAPGGNGQSWATAFKDLQDGIGMAARARGAVTEVWIAAGTYKPDRGTNDRYAAFRLANGVTLYGGFAGNETLLSQRNVASNPTLLSGDIGAANDFTDNSYHVLIADDRNNSAILDGVTIRDGYANGEYWMLYSGGGMLGRCSSSVLRNCTFLLNNATYVGGGAYLEESSQRFENCRFDSNSIAQYGGAVEQFNSTPEYVNCTFFSNVAVYAGGAVHCTTSSPTLTGCQFIANFSTYEFGFDAGFRGYNGSHPVLEGCTFNANEAYAVAALGIDGDSSVTVSNSTFIDNLADFSAGIELFGTTGTLVGCNFVTNFCGSDGTGYGGALTVSEQGSADLANCTFDQNYAGFGGGAIVSLGSTIHAERCDFIGNASWYGGAVWNDQGDTEYVNCRYFGNVANYGGGAVHDSGGGVHRFVSSIFSGNQTPNGYGGALFNYTTSSTTLTGCTLSANTAPNGGGGGIHSDGCTTTLSNSIVWGNSDFTGVTESAQLAQFNSPVYSVNYCNVQAWSGGFGGTGNVGLNPLFMDSDGADNVAGTLDDNLHLQTGSPCRDTGDPAFIATPPAEFDIDGQPRIMGCVVDRGADEYLLGGKHSGDLTADGTTDLADLPQFVAVLLSGGSPVQTCVADMNADGLVNGKDVQGFTAAIVGP